MSKSSLMSPTALLSEEDRALLNETSAPDLPSEMKNLIVHVQANSPELVAGDPKEYVSPSGERAFAGDWLLPRDGGRILVKGATGYEFLVVAGDRVFVEYKPARSGWVADHLEKPNDATWFEKDESPDGKAGLYRVGVDGNPGNRVEETIYAHELILPKDGSPPFTATQAFRSTATTVGRELMNRVSRKSPGGEVANPVLFKWLMSSQLERRGDYHWHKPLATLLGKFGEPNSNGPTIEQVRLGAQLRKAFKTGASWEAPLEPPTPPNPSAQIERSARERPGGSIAITSGRPALKSVEAAPPLEHDGGPDDGPDNDSYDNIPF
jgi:hypothetical protein